MPAIVYSFRCADSFHEDSQRNYSTNRRRHEAKPDGKGECNAIHQSKHYFEKLNVYTTKAVGRAFFMIEFKQRSPAIWCTPAYKKYGKEIQHFITIQRQTKASTRIHLRFYWFVLKHFQRFHRWISIQQHSNIRQLKQQQQWNVYVCCWVVMRCIVSDFIRFFIFFNASTIDVELMKLKER